jgi:hypothetical protein
MFMGTVMVFVQITVQAGVPIAKLGVASAAIQFSRSIGASFGAAITAALVSMALVGEGAGLYDIDRLRATFRLSLVLVSIAAAVGAALIASIDQGR